MKALFTTTVPVEIILAAGITPRDLNNDFITDSTAYNLVEKAEIRGFPRSSCAWIKGLYSVIEEKQHLFNETDIFIAVTEGDCSNARALAEVVQTDFNLKSYIFNYPHSRSTVEMKKEIERFASFLGTTVEKGEAIRKNLIPLREKLKKVDEISWQYPGLIKGIENHLWLVSSSDFNGNPDQFDKEISEFLNEKEKEISNFKPKQNASKIAFFGVPPIFDIYSFMEEKGAVFVFNEIQREFSMIKNAQNLHEQYTNYTYPYSASYRFAEAIKEIKKRNVDGIVHYVQAFCYRQIEQIILEKMNPEIPVVVIEGDKPMNKLDGRIKTRLEAFLETL